MRGLKQNLEDAVQGKQLAKPMSEADAEKLLYDFVFRP